MCGLFLCVFFKDANGLLNSCGEFFVEDKFCEKNAFFVFLILCFK